MTGLILRTTSKMLPSRASTTAITLSSHSKSSGRPTNEYAFSFKDSIVTCGIPALSKQSIYPDAKDFYSRSIIGNQYINCIARRSNSNYFSQTVAIRPRVNGVTIIQHLLPAAVSG